MLNSFKIPQKKTILYQRVNLISILNTHLHFNIFFVNIKKKLLYR